MKPLFIADPDHEDTENIFKLIKMLPDLVKQGCKTLFLEFVLRNPPEKVNDIAEQYIWCSHRDMKTVALAYAQLVVEARKLGMKVVGLSRPEYFANSGEIGTRLEREAFRILGGFDRIAAEIIRQESGPLDYVVFLGSGHWKHLSKHLTMDLVGESYDVSPEYPEYAVQTATTKTGELLKKVVLENVQIKFTIHDEATTHQSHISVLEGGKWFKISLAEGAPPEVAALLWEKWIGTKPDPDKLKIIFDALKSRILPPLKLTLKNL